MKKSILIALAVALATSAQAQVDEWVNPFKDYCEEHYADYGVYDYVQKQSKASYGDWFLIPSFDSNLGNRDKYPTLVNYNNETFVKINDDDKYQFVVVFSKPIQISEYESVKVDLKYNAIHFNGNNEKTEDAFVEARIEFIEKKKIDNIFEYVTKLPKSFYTLNANGEFVTKTGNSDYICVVLSKTNKDKDGYCLINNIEIHLYEGELNYYNTYKRYIKYFYEPYYMNNNGNIQTNITTEEDFMKYCDFKFMNYNNIQYKNEYINFWKENHPEIFEQKTEENQETPTTINDMESNTYVSNNILHTDEPSSVYVFNAGGILVKTENNTTSVDLSDLKKGVYIAKVNGAPIKFVR